jgi:hypothetical protein
MSKTRKRFVELWRLYIGNKTIKIKLPMLTNTSISGHC